MWIPQRIECKCWKLFIFKELGPDIEFGVIFSNKHILHERSETLLQPQIVPPFLNSIIWLKIKQFWAFRRKPTIVTKFPNQECASSWAITFAMRIFVKIDDFSGSRRRTICKWLNFWTGFKLELNTFVFESDKTPIFVCTYKEQINHIQMSAISWCNFTGQIWNCQKIALWQGHLNSKPFIIPTIEILSNNKWQVKEITNQDTVWQLPVQTDHHLSSHVQ